MLVMSKNESIYGDLTCDICDVEDCTDVECKREQQRRLNMRWLKWFRPNRSLGDVVRENRR